MPVAVNHPQDTKPKRDPLETIATGLQIANSVYGIKEANAKIGELERKQADEERKNKGIVTPEEYSDRIQKGMIPVDPSTPGAIVSQDTTGKTVAFAPPKPKAELTIPKTEVYRDAQGRNRIGTMTPQGLATSPKDALAGAQPSDKTPGEREPKPTQYQAATFGRRLEAAEGVFQNLQAQGYDRTSKTQGLLSALPGFAQPGQLKQQEQAERNFVNAQLRRESGSAISPSEFASAEQQYFPRAGDTSEVLAQKAQNRAIATQGLRKEAGQAWGEVGQIPVMLSNKNKNDKPFFVDGSGTAQAAAAKPTAQDSKAVDWAKKNSKDPRAAEILRLNGVK